MLTTIKWLKFKAVGFHSSCGRSSWCWWWRNVTTLMPTWPTSPCSDQSSEDRGDQHQGCPTRALTSEFQFNVSFLIIHWRISRQKTVARVKPNQTVVTYLQTKIFWDVIYLFILFSQEVTSQMKQNVGFYLLLHTKKNNPF